MSNDRIVQRYFDAWNAHDAPAIVATFAPGGTYADPTTPGPLSGAAIGENAEQLWRSFPDLAFEIRSHAASGDDFFAAEWVMTGTNTARLPTFRRRVTVSCFRAQISSERATRASNQCKGISTLERCCGSWLSTSSCSPRRSDRLHSVPALESGANLHVSRGPSASRR